MRSELRIEPFLRRLDLPELIKHIYPDASKEELGNMVDKSMEIINAEDFVINWQNNPDLRFGQLMFNLGCSFFDPIYNMEEYEILMDCGLPISKSLQWISYLDKDGHLLDKPISRFIDELDTDHLRTMVKEFFEGTRSYNEYIIDIFTKEIEARG